MDKISQLLEKVESLGGINAYSKNREAKSVWNAAFILYRRSFPRNRFRVGCESCRATVYKWMTENA